MHVQHVNIVTQQPVRRVLSEVSDFRKLSKSGDAHLNQYSTYDYSGKGTPLNRQRGLTENTKGYHANNWSLTAVEIKNKLGKIIGLENSLIFEGKKVKLNEYTDVNGKVHTEVSIKTFKKPVIKEAKQALKKLF